MMSQGDKGGKSDEYQTEYVKQKCPKSEDGSRVMI